MAPEGMDEQKKKERRRSFLLYIFLSDSPLFSLIGCAAVYAPKAFST